MTRQKLLKLFKITLYRIAFLFLQETHPSVDNVKQGSDNFREIMLYDYGTTNSCGVTIKFLGSKSLKVVQTKKDDEGTLLILDKNICGKELLLVEYWKTEVRYPN